MVRVSNICKRSRSGEDREAWGGAVLSPLRTTSIGVSWFKASRRMCQVTFEQLEQGKHTLNRSAFDTGKGGF